jgi:nucleoside-diphosphate-sugar epimerase
MRHSYPYHQQLGPLPVDRTPHPALIVLVTVRHNMSATNEPPERITSEQQLDEVLTRPQPALIEAMGQIQSPLIVLGASGKMGPSLCALARRAAQASQHDLEIIAVSRFTDRHARDWLESLGVQTITCDLLDAEALWKLPDCSNLIYLVGMKFGTEQNPALTWAVNTLVPSYVAERYSKARVTAVSTGNVYPFMPVQSLGATEQDPPVPVGEYGTTALARERMFEYASQRHGTAVVLLRLNYAVELRYGVLADIARKVWHGDPIDVTTGYLNCIWQADANDLILRSLPYASRPPTIFNLTGPAVLSVRELAQRFSRLLDRPVQITGAEAETALLSNPARICAELGPPPTSLDRVLHWTAEWVKSGGADLNKPTHFEVRSGKF